MHVAQTEEMPAVACTLYLVLGADLNGTSAEKE